MCSINYIKFCHKFCYQLFYVWLKGSARVFHFYLLSSCRLRCHWTRLLQSNWVTLLRNKGWKLGHCSVLRCTRDPSRIHHRGLHVRSWWALRNTRNDSLLQHHHDSRFTVSDKSRLWLRVQWQLGVWGNLRTRDGCWRRCGCTSFVHGCGQLHGQLNRDEQREHSMGHNVDHGATPHPEHVIVHGFADSLRARYRQIHPDPDYRFCWRGATTNQCALQIQLR